MRERHPKAPKSSGSARPRTVVIHRGSVDAVTTTPLTIRTMPIVWGIPMDELCYSLWFSNFVHLPIMPWDDIAITMSTYLPEARNFIHNIFLEKMTNIEWLVMLDSDVMPPPDFLERLLKHNKPMVGGWYRRKGGRNEPVVYDYSGMGADGKYDYHQRPGQGFGLESVDAAGAGCWLMHRKVAEAVGRSPYNMEHGGEDLELCQKVKAAGFDIWVDWSIACAHAGVGIT